MIQSTSNSPQSSVAVAVGFSVEVLVAVIFVELSSSELAVGELLVVEALSSSVAVAVLFFVEVPLSSSEDVGVLVMVEELSSSVAVGVDFGEVVVWSFEVGVEEASVSVVVVSQPMPSSLSHVEVVLGSSVAVGFEVRVVVAVSSVSVDDSCVAVAFVVTVEVGSSLHPIPRRLLHFVAV
jgi:hypothetical protein